VVAEDPRRALRHALRDRRRALSPAERERAALAVAEHLQSLGLPRPGSRVGAYLPVGGELDPTPLIEHALRRGCRVYVPAVTSRRARRMRFAPLAGPLRPNRWDIPEPSPQGSVHGRWLDLVLLPCVAFDDRGGRLGMGAGFYDRHFAYLRHRSAWRRPRLVGLAYAFQQVAPMAQRPWDVPLWAVVTDAGALRTFETREDRG
jgi:5-formyltetrahydrofolate cyclo-ligase